MSSPSSSDTLARIRGLHFRFGPRVIFDGADFDFQRGKVTAVMGPSGIGKTTLLRLMGGQYRPDAGTLHVDGVDVPALGRRELFEFRKRLGIMFQNGALLTDLNEECSGGMQRRIAFARAVALDPMLVMYDEPFTGQDPINLGVLARLVRKLNDALGLTSVIVSHDVAETLDISDYVYLISDGKVAAQGTPAEIRASKAEGISQFLKGEADGPVPFHVKAPDYTEDLIGVAPERRSYGEAA